MIDLARYADEVKAFVALADAFVDRTSTLRLQDIERDLNTGISSGAPRWCWETRDKILFRPSRAYDGPGKVQPETFLELGFKLGFKRDPRTNRQSSVWKIARSETHLLIRKKGGELPFHFDYKNPEQWGPQLHFQVSETLGNIGVPRIPSPTFLPTDCVDLALAELHHEAWRRRQAAGESGYNVSIIRKAQEHRTKAYLRDIATLWAADTHTTRVCMLQNYAATIAGLPDHKGREPVL